MKRRNVVAQRRRRTPRPKLQAPKLHSPALDRACTGQYPHTLLTMEEAAEYVGGFTGERRADSVRKLLQSHHVQLLRVGRDYRVRQSALDHFLETGEGQLDAIAAQTAQTVAGPTVSRS